MVLMVEDDPLLSSLLAQKLTSDSFHVVHVPSGEEALDVLQREQKPDLMLLDIRLPGIDGFGVLEKVRADASVAQLPVIVLSNFGEASDLARSKQLGVLRHIVKISITPDEITGIVRDALGKSKGATK